MALYLGKSRDRAVLPKLDRDKNVMANKTGSNTTSQRARVFVAGHAGMVGAAIVRELERDATVKLIVADRAELDLSNQAQVDAFFADHQIDQVYLAAARVGGIYANATYPADFLYTNLMIECNVMQAAKRSGVSRLLFLGSSCIYPKFASQPMREAELLTGALEPSNEAYALAKIAGLKMCDAYHRQYGVDFRALMPTNLYGRNDNFHASNSHVIPALMQRIHNAKINKEPSVVVWGTGDPLREFLCVDDLAAASVFVMQLAADQYHRAAPSPNAFLNVGTGQDCSIKELAYLLAEVIEYPGVIEFDTTKPDGTPRKLLDVSRLNALGWRPRIALKEGLAETYRWFASADKGDLRNYPSGESVEH